VRPSALSDKRYYVNYTSQAPAIGRPHCIQNLPRNPPLQILPACYYPRQRRAGPGSIRLVYQLIACCARIFEFKFSCDALLVVPRLAVRTWRASSSLVVLWDAPAEVQANTAERTRRFPKNILMPGY
jgi:hypothetical protein